MPRPAAKLVVGAVTVAIVSFFVKSLLTPSFSWRFYLGVYGRRKRLDELEKELGGGSDISASPFASPPETRRSTTRREYG